jgi:hypothetical protein
MSLHQKVSFFLYDFDVSHRRSIFSHTKLAQEISILLKNLLKFFFNRRVSSWV